MSTALIPAQTGQPSRPAPAATPGLRILVLQTGSCAHFLAATRAAVRRYPEASFVGVIQNQAEHEIILATGLFSALSVFSPMRGRLPSPELAIDACLIPFEHRWGIRYWTYRMIAIRGRLPLVLTYDCRGRLKTWGRMGWTLNTLWVTVAIRPIYEVALRLRQWLHRWLDVVLLFILAGAAVAYKAMSAAVRHALGRQPALESASVARRVVLFIPSLGVGGAQRQLVLFLANLDRRRWEPELVSLKQADNFFEAAIRHLDIPIHYLNPRGDFWMTGVVWRLVQYLRRRPCAVVHGWLHYAAGLGAIAGSLAGVPRVIGSLRSERPGRFPWFYPRWRRALDVLITPLLTDCIANSRAVLEENRRWSWIPRRKLHLVYNGIDLARLDVLDRDRLPVLRRALGLPPESRLVGIVGRLSPEKDHATFLRAARAIRDARPDTRFLIVGDGTSKAAIEQQMAALRLNGHVHLLGNRTDVLSLLRLMDVHVLTSTSEGFPNVLLEAAGVGTPVVTTAAGGAAEIVVHGETGYVVPCGDADNIADHVIQLLDDSTLRARLANAARDRVQQVFSITNMVQATESIYAAAPAQDLCFASPYAYGVLKPHSGLPIGGAELQLCTLAKALARHPGFRIALLTEYGRQRMVEREGAISIMTRALWGTARQRGAPAGPAEQSPTPPGLSVADRGRMLLRASPAPVAALLRAALRAGYRVVGAVRAVTQPGLAIARWITAIRATGAEIMVLRCATPHVGYARLASKLLGRKLVYMVAHEDEITGVYARRQSGGQWFEWGLTRADRVVCQHHEQGRLLARTYGKAAIILPSLRPCPIGGGDQSGRRVVLWIARFDTWKQPELLLDVAALFKDQPFVMVGPPSEATPGERTRLQDRIAALPNLRWIEHVPFERTLELFDDATVFVNTSLKEGFPNTFLQAAARGVPIVSWAINPDRVLDRFEFGFCAEGDRPTFEAQLRRLIADPDLRARLGENGRRYVAQFHDPNRIAEQYAALFRALVHGKGKVEARPAQTVTRKSAILKGNRALTE